MFCVWGLGVHSTSQTSYRLITNWTVGLRGRPAIIYFLRKFYENISLTLFILLTTSIEISSKTFPILGLGSMTSEAVAGVCTAVLRVWCLQEAGWSRI